MTENVMLALIALATLIATNLFALFRTWLAAKDATRAASQAHQAVDRVAAKLEEVHASINAQPDRADLNAAVVTLRAQLPDPAATPGGVVIPDTRVILVPDTRASG
jgi:hypothetical protein